MARVGSVPGYPYVVYRDEPPAEGTYNLHFPDILNNLASIQALDALAAIHLRVKRWKCVGSASFSKTASIAAFDEPGCSPDGIFIPTRTFNVTYSGFQVFTFHYINHIYDYRTSAPDLYIDPEGPLFSERLFAANKYEPDDSAPIDQTLMPYGPNYPGTTDGFESNSSGMSGEDFWGSTGYGAPGTPCGAYSVPFSGADDPTEEEGYRWWYGGGAYVTVTFAVVTVGDTFDVYATLNSGARLTAPYAPSGPIGPRPAGFFFADDDTEFSTNASLFTNPKIAGTLRVQVMAYSRVSTDPPVGGVVALEVPIYMEDPPGGDGLYTQTGICNLTFTPDTADDSILPYGHPGYTTENAIWGGGGVVQQNPLAPLPDSY